jgi:hypothetical protein
MTGISKRIAVVCGKGYEFHDFLNSLPVEHKDMYIKVSIGEAIINNATHKNVTYKSIGGIDDLRGAAFDDAIYYGTFYNRKNINELTDYLNMTLMYSRLNSVQKRNLVRRRLIKAIKEL